MNFPNPELTGFGIGLIIKALSGETINFTKVKFGNGGAPENLKELIDLSNPLMEVPIQGIKLGEEYVDITFSYDNGNLSDGFYMREMGIFAEDPETKEEKLYAYSYAGSMAGYLQPYDSTSFIKTTLCLAVVVGNAEKVTATIGEYSGYASNEEFKEHANNQENPHNVTKEQVGLGQVPNVSTENQTPVYTQSDSLEELKSKETLGVAFGKIARAISSLIAHLKANNPHGISASKIGAAEKLHGHSATDIISGTLSVARGGTGGTSAATALKSLGAVPRSGCTDMTGDIWWSNYTTGARGIGGMFADNDYWRVVGRSDSSDNGYIELGTGDNGNDPILARQYNDSEKGTGKWSSIKRTAYILNGSGNTVFPGSCTATSHPTTSDLKKKDVDGELRLKTAMDIVMGLKPITYRFKGDDKKQRMGFGAQHVFKLMQSLGIKESAMYKADRKKPRFGEEHPETDLTDDAIRKTSDKKLDWSVDYEQIIAPMVAVIQNQERRISELEKTLKEVKGSGN